MNYIIGNNALEITLSNNEITLGSDVSETTLSVNKIGSVLRGPFDSSGNLVRKPILIHIDKNTPSISHNAIDMSGPIEVTINLNTKFIEL